MSKNLGDQLINTSLMAFAGGMVAIGATSVTVLGTGVTGLASLLSPLLMFLFSMLFIPGVVLAYIVPMVPYILWIGVVLGWMILLIEAMIAAPLWAIVHLAPDGDGVVGRGGQGYMLVLSLMLRPALMVLGLVAAIILMKPIGFLVNSTFYGAFNLSVSPGTFGVLAMMVGSILYAVLMFTIISRVFALIHVVPDRLLRWIGSSGGELGQEAGNIEQMSTAKTIAGLGAMKMTGDLARSAGQGVAQLNAQRGAERAQLMGNADARENAAKGKLSQSSARAMTERENPEAMAEASRDARELGDASLMSAAAYEKTNAGAFSFGNKSNDIEKAVKSGKGAEYAAREAYAIEDKKRAAEAKGGSYYPSQSEQKILDAFGAYQRSANPQMGSASSPMKVDGETINPQAAVDFENVAGGAAVQSEREAVSAASSGDRDAQKFVSDLESSRSSSNPEAVGNFFAEQAERANKLESSGQQVPGYLQAARMAYHAERASGGISEASTFHKGADQTASSAFGSLAISGSPDVRKNALGLQNMWNRAQTPESRASILNNEIKRVDAAESRGEGDKYPPGYRDKLEEALGFNDKGASTFNDAVDSIREYKRLSGGEE
jgi:hypothetical protein